MIAIADSADRNDNRFMVRETWYVILELEDGFHVWMEGSTSAIKRWAYYAIAGAKIHLRSTRDADVRRWVQKVL